jgi:hypothetical protein
MRPSTSELIKLNPILARKSQLEIEQLITAIEDCGYAWDDRGMSFYNPKLQRSISTQGLDLFTPESIKSNHASMLAECEADPARYNSYAKRAIRWSIWGPKVIGTFFLILFFGWIILPIKYWLAILTILFFAFLIIRPRT